MIGEVERERVDIKRVVLVAISIAGILSFALIAPNAVQLLKHVLPNKRKDRHYRYYVKTVTHRLEKKKLIRFVKNSRGQKCATLTPAGKRELKRYEMGKLTIPVPKRWDGKYRLIIFDIKEWKRSVRDKLRAWLEHLGFVRLQNSVWVYPHECREVITLLKSYFRIGKDVLYITADSIENDGWLKKRFNLV